MKFLIIVVLSLLVSTVAAFSCYQCQYYEDDNKTDSRCNKDSLPEEFLVPCKLPNYPEKNPDWQCVKKSGKTTEDEKKFVHRYCSAGKSYENTCKESNGLGTPYGTLSKAFKCYCSDEKCNGASAISATFLMLPLITLIGYYIH